MNIGFDFDGVFIDKPPFVPKTVIEWLFRSHNTTRLSYRKPGSFEKIIRRISHTSFLRPSLKENVNFIKQFKKQHPKIKLFLISARFSFLEKPTQQLLKREGLDHFFDGYFLNTTDQQPHVFKEKMIKKLHIDLFIDDDLPLLSYLAKRNKKPQLIWLANTAQEDITVTHIQTIRDVEHYL